MKAECALDRGIGKTGKYRRSGYHIPAAIAIEHPHFIVTDQQFSVDWKSISGDYPGSLRLHQSLNLLCCQGTVSFRDTI